MQRVIKLHVHVGKDHLVRLPSEFPEGPAEAIVIAAARLPVARVPHRGQPQDIVVADADVTSSARHKRTDLISADAFD